MAIIIRGETICPLCQMTIQEGENVVAFPAFVWNQCDPIFIFNDAACHAACFHRHLLAGYAQERYEALQKSVGPGLRECSICHHQITNPNDYLLVGHLTDDPEHFLHQFNYAQFHRLCFSKWNGREMLVRKIKHLDQSGEWCGDGLKALLVELTSAI